MDQKKSWWTLLRESLVDPQPRTLQQSCSPLQLSLWDTAVSRIHFKNWKGTRVSSDNFLLLRKATFTVFKQVSWINLTCLCWAAAPHAFGFTQVLFNNVKQCNCGYNSNLNRCQEVLLTAQVCELTETSLVCYLQQWGVTVTPSVLPGSHRAHLLICYLLLTLRLIGKGGNTHISGCWNSAAVLLKSSSKGTFLRPCGHVLCKHFPPAVLCVQHSV